MNRAESCEVICEPDLQTATLKYTLPIHKGIKVNSDAQIQNVLDTKDFVSLKQVL